MNSQTIRSNLKKAYDNYFKENEAGEGAEPRPWQVQQRDQFLTLLQAERKQSLLDLGAGSGNDSEFFIARGFSVLAVDLSPEMVRACNEQGIDTRELDFFNLEQLQQRFGAIWAMNSLIHVEKRNLPLILQKIADVLHPSGLFFLCVYGGYDFEGVLENDIFKPARFFSFYTDAGLREALTAKFELLQFTPVESTHKYHPQCVILRKPK